MIVMLIFLLMQVVFWAWFVEISLIKKHTVPYMYIALAAYLLWLLLGVEDTVDVKQ